MKLNRLFIAALLGFSLLTTSALACDHSSGSSSGEESHWSFFSWNHRDTTHHDEEKNRGKECDPGRGNDSSGCSTSGKGTGGGTSTGSTGGTSSGGSTGKGISN